MYGLHMNAAASESSLFSVDFFLNDLISDNALAHTVHSAQTGENISLITPSLSLSLLLLHRIECIAGKEVMEEARLLRDHSK